MALSAGARLCPYEIQSPLGAGGMGEVYRARDTKLRRDVAIKILPEAFTADPDRIARFQREAELLAALNHPNVAAVYGIEESTPSSSGHATFAIVLELVEGETLAERIARGLIELDETLSIARQIAGALEAAHDRGVVHRDLKPANIKITPDGIVKVLDFGLAKMAEREASGVGLSASPTFNVHATQAGVILGTAAYMSPEQARGKPVDRRADIWAFGCVLYEMLTGRKTFEGGDTVSALAVGSRRSSPREYGHAHRTAHQSCFLARRPVDCDVSEDKTLRRVAVEGGIPVTICSLEAIPFGMSWDAGGLLFEADGAITRVSPDGGKPETLIARSTSDRERSPQMLPDGQTVMFTVVDANVNTRNIGGSEYPSRIVAQTARSSERHVLIEGAMEGRYLPTGHLAYVSHGVLFAVPFDLRRLKVTGGPVPLVQGVRSEGGTALYAVSTTGSLAYVPGTEAGIGGEQNLGFIDRTGKVDFLKLEPATYLYPRLSPDGGQLAVEIDRGNDANISIYDLSGRSALRRLTFGGRNRIPAWSADGHRLAFQSDRDGDLAIFSQRADGAGSAERLTTPEKDATHIPDSWSAKGELLFTVAKGAESTLWLYSARDRTSRQVDAVRSSRQPTNAAFSPNGLWVAYQSNETGTPAVYVQPFPPTGSRFQASPVAPQLDPHHPQWSRDGTELFYVAGPNRFVVTKVTERSGLSFSNPVPINTGTWRNTFGGPTTVRNYDVSLDGKYFIGVIASGVTESGIVRAPQIQVVLNWFEEVRRLVASK